MKRVYLQINVAVVLCALAMLAAAQVHHSELPLPFATPSATKFPIVIGWPANKTPQAPEGFQVDLFASNLDGARWIYVLPNNDVLVAQSKTEDSGKDSPELKEKKLKAKMIGASPNQITLLRDADKNGSFETRKVFLSKLRQPFGMLLVGADFYVANTDSVMRYPYKKGSDHIEGDSKMIAELPAGGYNYHWTRNIVVSGDGTKLYVTVGSQTNVDEEGLDAKEPSRAAILEMNLDGSNQRIFASGLRNPNGMDFFPRSNALWTVVNERDETGDDLVPDFLTAVQDNGFYGWPYSYFGQHQDPRHKGKRPELVAKAILPDVPLGAHTASLGMTFYRATAFPEHYRNGAFIGQHGSWNRSKFSGYQVAFVPFTLKDGRPAGPIEPFLTGFIASDERSEVYGRPVGVAVLQDGSLLVADDADSKIWRVRYMGGAKK